MALSATLSNSFAASLNLLPSKTPTMAQSARCFSGFPFFMLNSIASPFLFKAT